MTSIKNCRRFAMALATFGALIAVSTACAKRQAPLSTQAQPYAPQEVAFQVKGVPAVVGSEAPIFAEYGIEFRIPGTFEVGPAPNGQVHQDSLSDQEKDQLQKVWKSWMKDGFSATETCFTLDAQSPLASTQARISILLNQREKALVRIDGGQLCGSAEKTALEAFANTLMALAKAHYPKTFPSDCLASTDALKKQYNEVTSCQSDEECANLDSQYLAIPAGQVHYVALKTCSVVPHLAAANISLIPSGRSQLLQAREAARASCAADNRELVCTAEADIGFQNHRYPARCIAAKCAPGKSLQ